MLGRRASFFVWLFSLVAVALMAGRPALAEPYRLTIGDSISVKVVGESDYSKSYTINDQGQIFVPNIGNLTVNGKTSDEVQDLLTKRLKEYIKNPAVTVEITSPQENTVFVNGEVNKKGGSPIRIKPDTTLVSLIEMAGGLTDNADKTKLILQRRGEKEPRTINLKAILDDGDMTNNIVVQPGDTFYIPPKEPKTALGKFKVLGLVKNPGEKDFHKDMTPMEAITLANGFADDADMTDVILQHKDGSKIALNLEAAAQGTPDPLMDNLFIQEGDVIQVHNNKNNQITVSGPGVKSPGTFLYENGMTLMDAITKAGDFAERAKKREVTITRKNSAPVMIDVDKYYKTADTKLNPPLQRGDIVRVEQSDPPKEKTQNPIWGTLVGTLGSILVWRTIYR